MMGGIFPPRAYTLRTGLTSGLDSSIKEGWFLNPKIKSIPLFLQSPFGSRKNDKGTIPRDKSSGDCEEGFYSLSK